jgi:hypothetical protein
VKITPPRRKSKLHEYVADVLRAALPSFTLEEEVTLPTEVRGRRTTLFVDMVVKELRIAVECHGEQHYRFNSHFHSGQQDYEEQKRRDLVKKADLEASGYHVLVIPYSLEGKLTPRKVLKMIEQLTTKRS